MSNIKYQINKRGFTFIELLAVMAVLLVIGGIVTSILFTALRGTTKTGVINDVRQNGNSAITQMAKMLRGAKSLDDPNVCVPPPAPTPAPSYSSLTFTSFDEGVTKFSCDLATDSSPATISSNGAALLNKDAVSVESCSFSCSQASMIDYPTISIDFSLKSYSPRAVNSLVERVASASAIPFHTSIILRNVKR